MDFLDKKIEAYSALHTSSESNLLNDLNRETYANVMNPRMLSGHLQGRILALISKMIRPKKIIEIGTYTGYSALCLAEGLEKNGEIHTIDINEEYTSIANKYFNKSKYKHNIKSFVGNGIDVIKDLNYNYQLAFIDADKSNYSNYYDALIDKIDKGGIIIADNVLWSGKIIKKSMDHDTLAIDNYNKKIINDPRVETLLLPIRDGIMVSRKI
tara:strand:+ start:134 stop:769 length:636 start_codon:yes stop_codon:yes gene_type:complete